MNDILLESRRFGAIVKVNAVDAASGVEVSFQAPAMASQGDLQRLAAAKLRYVMQKK